MHVTITAAIRAEHSAMRQMLSTLNAVVRAGQWRDGGPALRRLRDLLEFQELFLEVCLDPQSSALAQALRARSSAAKDHGDVRQQNLADDAALRRRLPRLLDAVECSAPGSADALEELIEQRRSQLLERMTWESEVLLAQARDALSAAQWTQIAASIDAMPKADPFIRPSHMPPCIGRRAPESPARFTHTGFMLDGCLDFEQVPMFSAAAPACR